MPALLFPYGAAVGTSPWPWAPSTSAAIADTTATPLSHCRRANRCQRSGVLQKVRLSAHHRHRTIPLISGI